MPGDRPAHETREHRSHEEEAGRHAPRGARADNRAHHAHHAGHETMFRRRFWVCLLLSLPVLFFSPSLQGWLNYSAPSFSGSAWITP
ncbi:MAG TPA: heavy metal translocating P-type ATPase, partial [Thermoleophilia bacterium]|nr:heavy metal translocating P-type ATPase [Thermoleophilia bacterium]